MKKGIAFRTLFQSLPGKFPLCVLGVVTRLVSLFAPLLIGSLVNHLTSASGSYVTIMGLTGTVLLFELCGIIFAMYEERCAAASFADMECTLKKKFWKEIQRLPLEKFDAEPEGVWMEKISGDISMVVGACRGIIVTGLNFFVYFLGTLIIILLRNPWLITVFIIAVVLNISTHLYFRNRIAQSSKKMREQRYRECTSIFGFIGIHPLLIAFGVDTKFTSLFENTVRKSRHRNVILFSLLSQFKLCLEAEFWFIRACVLVFCVWGCVATQLTVGDMVAYTMLIGQLLSGVSGLIYLLPDLDMGMDASRSIQETLEQVPREAHSPVEEKISRLDSKIKIHAQEVSFHYASREENVIQGFTAQFLTNEFICLLGRNGSGKSTLIRILLGLYTPTHGVMERNVFRPAWVPQRIIIYRDSLLENIRLRDSEISVETVNNAIQVCGLASFVQKIPQGLYGGITPETLSGGELQAIGIARAWVRHPDLLVLDEVTNNLDVVARGRIQSVLKSLKRHCTIIAVTHDPETAELADRLFVFNKNAIQEIHSNMPRERLSIALKIIQADNAI